MLVFLFIVIGLAVFVGIFFIVEGILFYAFAEEKEATVVDRRERSIRGRRSYYISVELSDLGEKRVVPVDEAFPVSLEGNMEIGDKIIVWYLKKFKVCAYDRSKSIKEGLEIVLVIAACVIGPIIFSVIFS